MSEEADRRRRQDLEEHIRMTLAQAIRVAVQSLKVPGLVGLLRPQILIGAIRRWRVERISKATFESHTG